MQEMELLWVVYLKIQITYCYVNHYILQLDESSFSTNRVLSGDEAEGRQHRGFLQHQLPRSTSGTYRSVAPAGASVEVSPIFTCTQEYIRNLQVPIGSTSRTYRSMAPAGASVEVSPIFTCIPGVHLELIDPWLLQVLQLRLVRYLHVPRSTSGTYRSVAPAGASVEVSPIFTCTPEYIWNLQIHSPSRCFSGGQSDIYTYPGVHPELIDPWLPQVLQQRLVRYLHVPRSTSGTYRGESGIYTYPGVHPELIDPSLRQVLQQRLVRNLHVPRSTSGTYRSVAPAGASVEVSPVFTCTKEYIRNLQIRRSSRCFS